MPTGTLAGRVAVITGAGRGLGAALAISLGSVWLLVAVWVRARVLLRRVRRLHTTLVKRFPEVVVEDQTHTTTVLRASDHVAHIMDALYLQAGGGIDTQAATPAPATAEGTVGSSISQAVFDLGVPLSLVLSLGCAIAAGYILNALFPIPLANAPQVADWVAAHIASYGAQTQAVIDYLAANPGTPVDAAIRAVAEASSKSRTD